eukprot:TRINITY_DN9954_c0_g2_i1.p1 TRINITY_DN9954_c0_g2~~TRINITY_DN9954_c0_g2_i1.p1  ORF type:complete len:186 (+),score=39.57 TRINITY_DN9954_c0_g2_i1:391-948(+)
MILHGKSDNEVIPRHSENIYEKVTRKVELWLVEGGDHINIETAHRRTYIQKMEETLAFFNNAKANKTEKELLEAYRGTITGEKLNHPYYNLLEKVRKKLSTRLPTDVSPNTTSTLNVSWKQFENATNETIGTNRTPPKQEYQYISSTDRSSLARDDIEERTSPFERRRESIKDKETVPKILATDN